MHESVHSSECMNKKVILRCFKWSGSYHNTATVIMIKSRDLVKHCTRGQQNLQKTQTFGKQ